MWSCAPRKWNLTESEMLMWWTSLRVEHTEPLYYLPSYTAAPVLNLTLRLSLTLTLLLQTPRTLNYRRAVRHPNRLHSPFCTNTRSSTAHQQQVHNISTTPTTSPQLVVQQIHNKSYKWSVGFNVNGRTFCVITVRPTYQMAYIHTSHRHTDGAQVCQAAYTISKDVRHSLASLIGTARRDGRFGASPTPPACLSLAFWVGTDGQT